MIVEVCCKDLLSYVSVKTWLKSEKLGSLVVNLSHGLTEDAINLNSGGFKLLTCALSAKSNTGTGKFLGYQAPRLHKLWACKIWHLLLSITFLR